MAKSVMNLQDSFLNQIRKESTEIKMVLLDGTVLIGTVRGFDSFTVILSSRGSQHLIYKHAIGQIISKKFSNRRDDQGSRSRGPESARPRHDPPAKEEPRKESFNTLNLSEVVSPGRES